LNSESATAEVRPPLSRGRKVLFGLLLLLLVLVVPLGLLEFGLRLAGYGYETDFLLERTVNGRRVFTDNPKFAHRFFPARIARSPQTLLADAEWCWANRRRSVIPSRPSASRGSSTCC
jgi:hypothetical protein